MQGGNGDVQAAERETALDQPVSQPVHYIDHGFATQAGSLQPAMQAGGGHWGQAAGGFGGPDHVPNLA